MRRAWRLDHACAWSQGARAPCSLRSLCPRRAGPVCGAQAAWGPRVSQGARRGHSHVLGRPWCASPCLWAAGRAWLPLCTLRPGLLCAGGPGSPPLQPPLLLNPQLHRSPWALLLARVHTAVPQLTCTSSTRSHLPPCRGLGLRLGRLLIWSGVREALSQARGKRVAGRLPRPPHVSGSIAGGPGCVSLWPCEHSRHPGGPRTTSPTGTEPAVLASDLSPGSGILQGPRGSPGLRSCGVAKGSW